MKTWKSAEVLELNIDETANGKHWLWTEGEKRLILPGYHTTGLSANTNTNTGTETVAEEITEEIIDEGTTNDPS